MDFFADVFGAALEAGFLAAFGEGCLVAIINIYSIRHDLSVYKGQNISFFVMGEEAENALCPPREIWENANTHRHAYT